MAPHKQLPESFRNDQALAQELNDTGQQLNAANADFLKIDMETALTFSGLALETDNEEKKQRNRKNARKAYDTVLRLLGKVTLTPAEEGNLREKLSHLKQDLELLGETF